MRAKETPTTSPVGQVQGRGGLSMPGAYGLRRWGFEIETGPDVLCDHSLATTNDSVAAAFDFVDAVRAEDRLGMARAMAATSCYQCLTEVIVRSLFRVNYGEEKPYIDDVQIEGHIDFMARHDPKLARQSTP